MSKEKSYDIRDLGLLLCKFLEEKKATDVVLMDIHRVNPYFDLFLIASANSIPHIGALEQDVIKNFSEHISMTGYKGTNAQNKDSGWIVIDMIHIVIHLFLQEQRSFYNIERLWGDASVLYPKGKEKNTYQV